MAHNAIREQVMRKRIMHERVMHEQVMHERAEKTRFYVAGGWKFMQEHCDHPPGLLSSKVMITSGTGSGKTTCIAQYKALEAMEVPGNFTVITVPQRNSARSLCRYLNEGLPEQLFGYAIGNEQDWPKTTVVLFVTAGWLVTKILNNPEFMFTTLVLDEAHDVAEDTDMAYRCMRHLLKSRNFDVIISSATITATTFLQDFPELKVFDEDCNNNYVNPVRFLPKSDYRYMPPSFRNGAIHVEVCNEIVKIVGNSSAGNILIFYPGEAEIEALTSLLTDKENKIGRRLADFCVSPLYSSLSIEEQDAALIPDPAGRRKIIISTNVAESSITPPGVCWVISSGYHRIMHRHDDGSQELILCSCSQNNLMQQRGRGNRTLVLDELGQPVVNGYSVMLMTEDQFNELPQSAVRELDNNPLYSALIKVIGSNCGSKIVLEEFFDSYKVRLVKETGYLIRHKLVENIAKAPESAGKEEMFWDDPEEKEPPKPVYQVTELGRNVSRIPTSIPGARLLYILATEQKISPSELFASCAIVASTELSIGPYFIPRELLPYDRKQDLLKHMQEFKKHETGIDSFDNMLALFYEYEAQPKKHRSSWCMDNKFFGRYFETLSYGAARMAKALEKLGFEVSREPIESYPPYVAKVWDIFATVYDTMRFSADEDDAKGFHRLNEMGVPNVNRPFRLNRDAMMQLELAAGFAARGRKRFRVLAELLALRVTVTQGGAGFISRIMLHPKNAELVAHRERRQKRLAAKLAAKLAIDLDY
jgi:HrpA-like RNA helicase